MAVSGFQTIGHITLALSESCHVTFKKRWNVNNCSCVRRLDGREQQSGAVNVVFQTVRRRISTEDPAAK